MISNRTLPTATTESILMSPKKGRHWLASSATNSNRAIPRNKTTTVTYEIPTIAMPYFMDAESSFAEKTEFDVATNDLSQSPGEWIKPPSPVATPIREQPQTVELAVEPTVELKVDAAINGLVDSILERFPLAAPAILLFVGSEENPHTDSTCSRVGTTLAGRNIGNVLIVDSNADRLLTHQIGLINQPGLSNIVNEECNWQELVANHRSAALDFLPAGRDVWTAWGGRTRLRKAAAE